jgi:phosphomevalonate kinase
MPTINVPGKLMLAGEWSILEPGNRCIVMAVDKYVKATITKMDPGADAGMTHTATITTMDPTMGQAGGNKGVPLTFNLPDLGLPAIAAAYQDGQVVSRTPLTPEQAQQFSMCQTAAEVALNYLQDIKHQAQDDTQAFTPFTLTITSDNFTIRLPDGSTTKLGLGSSAAAVVATIKAIFTLHGHDPSAATTLDRIFKLAVLAHYAAQGNCGSGFDIAAATYGTTLVYQRFNPTWLAEQQQCTPLATLVAQPWPDLEITPIKLPPNLLVLVGFSGASANTSTLIASMNAYKKAKPHEYAAFAAALQTVVHDLEHALATANTPNILAAINRNRMLLAQLANQSGINLETPALTTLITIANHYGAAAKFSGAGGGDCGIALCTNTASAEQIKHAWQQAGITPLKVGILTVTV